MYEQDQELSEFALALVNSEAAQRRFGTRSYVPEAEADLKRFVRGLNRLALRAARDLDLPYGLRFTVHSIIRFEEGHEEAVEAWMNADDSGLELDGLEAEIAAAETLVGYQVRVTPVSRERLERRHREQMRRREAALMVDRALRARQPRGARRRGAGRPGHRSRQRANAPPAGDDPADPEPHPAARQTRRAACCLGWWR